MMDAPYCQKHHNTVGVATCKLCIIDELKAERDKYRKQVQLGFKHLVEVPVLTDEAIEEGYTVVEHLRLALAKALGERDELLAAADKARLALIDNERCDDCGDALTALSIVIAKVKP